MKPFLKKTLKWKDFSSWIIMQSVSYWLATGENVCYGRFLAAESQFCEKTISKVALKLFAWKIHFYIKQNTMFLMNLL